MDGVVAALVFAAAALPTHASELDWMSGCWRADGERGKEEHWLQPTGGALLGVSRNVVDGRIEGTVDGKARDRFPARARGVRLTGQWRRSSRIG